MKAVKREIEQVYERWFPFLDGEEEDKVKAGFEAWVKDNHVEVVLAPYQDDEELMRKCMKVLLINLEEMDARARASYLRMYPYQEDLMNQVRKIWSYGAERYQKGTVITEVVYSKNLEAFYEKYRALRREAESGGDRLESDFQSLEGDVLLDLDYASGKTEQKSHWLSERLE